MYHDRREFLERLTLGTAALGAIPFITPAELAAQAGSHWDMSWTDKVRGKRRAVFDVPEIEDGYGVWRAIIWKKQYGQVFRIPESQLSVVLILRHNAIALAMNQAFWEKYGIGTAKGVKDPITTQPTRRNPVVDRTGANALPEQFADFYLEAFMAGGGVALACALAFRDCVSLIAQQDQVAMDEADRRARGYLVPGIVMQPSGVFAATVAQEYGCRYVRAS